MPTTRPLIDRVIEYRNSLLSVADQIDTIARTLAEAGKTDNIGPLNETARHNRGIADDLTMIINGEELLSFRLEGELDLS